MQAIIGHTVIECTYYEPLDDYVWVDKSLSDRRSPPSINYDIHQSITLTFKLLSSNIQSETGSATSTCTNAILTFIYIVFNIYNILFFKV